MSETFSNNGILVHDVRGKNMQKALFFNIYVESFCLQTKAIFIGSFCKAILLKYKGPFDIIMLCNFYNVNRNGLSYRTNEEIHSSTGLAISFQPI